MPLSHVTVVDYIVIIVFMVMLASIGFIFDQFTKNAREYFIGANKVSWWLAGASLFMAGFSANTFTGAMGIAYNHGLTGLFITWSFVTGFTFAFFFTAARWRQTRCITEIEMLRSRFGLVTERTYAIISMPSNILTAAIWMYGLAIFTSTVLRIEITHTLIITGVVILIYSTLGGSVAVQCADFMQAVILLPLTILFAVLVLLQPKVGGLTGLVQQLPEGHLNPINATNTLPWLIIWHLQGMLSFGGASPRYLGVRDGRAARKVALLTASLFFIGPIFWYIPALASRIYYPDLNQTLPGLSKPAEGAYAIMALNMLPTGVIGLMVAAMFAATMSSLDSAFNSNAGIFVVNIYKGWLRKGAGHRESVLVGRLANVSFGVLIILTALYFSRIKQEGTQVGVFDITIAIVSAIGYPMCLPRVLMVFFRRTPRWSALFASACGIVVGIMGQAKFFPGLQWLSPYVAKGVHALGLPEIWAKQPWSFPVQSLTVLVTMLTALVISRFFWRLEPAEIRRTIEGFNRQMETPVDAELEVEGNEDHRFLVKIGVMVLCVGAALMLLQIYPRYALGDRLIVLILSGVTLLIGLLMLGLGRASRRKLLALQAAAPASAPEVAAAADSLHNA